MPAAPDGSFGAGWWQCVALAPDRRPLWLAVVGSAAHPAGTRVELLAPAAEREVGGAAACIADLDDEARVVRLRLGPSTAITGADLWFAELQETTGQPPATNLVAFPGGERSPGALLDESALANAGVPGADQVGAVRWYPASGEVDQIYVQPAWRRRRVGSALIAAAAALSYARDWPRLWADGQRTDLGERFRNASPWRARTAELTHVAPPMTPGEAAPPAAGRPGAAGPSAPS